MDKLLWLIRREYWENKNMLFKLPVLIMLFFMGAMLLVLALSLFQFTDSMSFVAQTDALNGVQLNIGGLLLIGLSYPYMLLLRLIVFIYAYQCLFQDRKDGSILFWMSLPISTPLTITAKTMAALVIAPFFTWCCTVVTTLVFLLLLSITALTSPVLSLSSLWSFHNWLMVYPGLLMTFYLQALWIFPLFGMACCCSAYAKKSPFLLSVVLLFLIMVIEVCVFHYSYVYHFVSQHLSIIGMTHDPFTRLFHGSHGGSFLNKGMPVHQIYSIYSYESLFIGIVVGFVFLCMAGVRRARFRQD